MLAALLLWLCSMFAAWIRNNYNNSYCLLIIGLNISYWLLNSRWWSMQDLLGWDAFRRWHAGGSARESFLLLRTLSSSKDISGLCLKQKVLSYRNVFLYCICIEFSLFWSPKCFRSAHCSDLLSFARCYKMWPFFPLLIYQKCKAKFCLSNKCAVWW